MSVQERYGKADSDAYLLTCMRYIELNPVRAGMVDHPADYPWSSYPANALSLENNLLDHHPIYLALGATGEERANRFNELFHDQIDHDTMHQIRDNLNHELVLGRACFKDKIGKMTHRSTRPGKRGRPRVEEEQGDYLFI